MDNTEKKLEALINYLGVNLKAVETFCDVAYINDSKRWGERSAEYGASPNWPRPEKKDYIHIDYKVTKSEIGNQQKIENIDPHRMPILPTYDFGKSEIQ